MYLWESARALLKGRGHMTSEVTWGGCVLRCRPLGHRWKACPEQATWKFSPFPSAKPNVTCNDSIIRASRAFSVLPLRESIVFMMFYVFSYSAAGMTLVLKVS